MAIRVYDAALKNSAYQDSFDRYSVVFLLPYHLERKYNMRGCMIACSPSHYGSDMIIVETQEIGLGVHINSNEFYALNNVAEDAYLSFALKKYLNISTFVPPHHNRDFFSSTKGEEYGKGEDSISIAMPNLQKMNEALKILKYKYGMKEVSFSFKWYLVYISRKIARRIISDEDKLNTIKSKIKLFIRK